MTSEEIGKILDAADLIIKVAKAIEGPHVQNGASTERFNRLRDIRWEMLSEHERRNRINQASAVVFEIMGVLK